MDIERFRDQLKRQQEEYVRGHQHSLDLARLEHQVKFSRLYEKRFLKIEELYVDSLDLLKLLNAAIGPEPSTRAERIRKAANQAHSLQSRLMLFRIYLPLEFVNELDQELTKLHEHLYNFSSAWSDPEQPLQPELRKAVDEIAATMRKLSYEIGDHARRILEPA